MSKIPKKKRSLAQGASLKAAAQQLKRLETIWVPATVATGDPVGMTVRTPDGPVNIQYWFFTRDSPETTESILELSKTLGQDVSLRACKALPV